MKREKNIAFHLICFAKKMKDKIKMKFLKNSGKRMRKKKNNYFESN